nr:unnamed protein product [Callosobruchus chinensis]
MLLLEGISQLCKFKLIIQNAISPDWTPKCVNTGAGGGGLGAVVISKETALPKSFPPLVLHNYNFQYTVFVENTGHSIKLNLSSDDEKYDQNDLPAISGSVLEGRYILETVHFHWEADHAINGCSFPLEGHFVHVPEDPNGGGKHVVLSVLYQVSIDKRIQRIMN